MFNTTYVYIYRHPVDSGLLAANDTCVPFLSKPQEIPRGVNECIHGISLALSWIIALWALCVQPMFSVLQWVTTFSSELIFFQSG